MIDDRDGVPRFYDINALSNFVAKPLDVLGWDPHDRLVDYLETVIAEGTPMMRYGYWTPVFGGWLRNVRRRGDGGELGLYETADPARRSRLGYDLTLIAELNLNDIKGVEQPALDAWSTAAALAAVTETDRADGRGATQLPSPRAVCQGRRQYRPDRGRDGLRSTSCRRGGRTRRSNMACSSTSMTIAMRGPRNG